MKTNKPITKTIEIDGVEKDILLDRLAVVMNINAFANINNPIIQSGLISFKKCSADGWIFNDDEYKLSFSDITKETDDDVLICFAKFEAALTELANKKGL